MRFQFLNRQLLNRDLLDLEYIDAQRGASLIEVMVSLFILAVGILGVLSMQLQAMRATKSASIFSEASYLANDIMESIRASNDPALYEIADISGATGTAPNCDAVGTPCDPGQLASYNLITWGDNVADKLPGADATIEVVNRAVPLSAGTNYQEITVTLSFKVNLNTDEDEEEYVLVSAY